MSIFTKPLPLSLYIHIPWCVRKCPYCDFNSHEAKTKIPEDLYVSALLEELDNYSPWISHRPIISIFFGGGTPSLFSAEAIATILEGVKKRWGLADDVEITLEANPGTIDQSRFAGLKQAGINRLSLGIQSLQNEKLKQLGRIHDAEQAAIAIKAAKKAGFTNFNLDIMYGLPEQSLEDALTDINMALSFSPTHFSWYQLTLEPNTLFFKKPPVLPNEDAIWEMQQAGQALIDTQGYQQYEVSAYAANQAICIHNKNYWEFGDYLGIGAGAHSKITDEKTHAVWRFSQVKHPKDYLDKTKRNVHSKNQIAEDDIIFEFMLNALRLSRGVSLSLFTERTGISSSHIESLLNKAKQRQLLIENNDLICPTTLGKRFLNDLIAIFLPLDLKSSSG